MDRKLAFILVSTVLSIGLLLRKGFEMAGLSISYIQRTGAYPYAVLGLCLLMLYSKRGVVAAAAEKNNVDLSYRFAGAVLIALSFLTPVGEPATQVFAALLLWLGAFTTFYGVAAILPMAFLSIYGFAIVLPGFIASLGSSFPLATTIVLTRLLQPFIPISHLGQTIKFTDVSGGVQSYYVDAACSGSAALTV